jgi:SMI1 / KNR4 family (SUKH-1)
MDYALYLTPRKPPISKDELVAFESTNKIKLPEPFKELLQFANGSSTINPYLPKENECESAFVSGFMNLDQVLFAMESMQEVEKEMGIYYYCDVLFPIGIEGGGWDIYYGIKGSYESKIYYLAYEDYDGTEGSVLHYIAPSIENLLKRLVSEIDYSI